MKVILKKLLLLVALIIISYGCSSKIVQHDNRAQEEYLSKLSIVEEYVKTRSYKDSRPLDNAVEFLEQLTSIRSSYIAGIDPFIDPTKQNLRAWTNWFKKNKARLYWDEKEQKTKLR